MKQKFIPLLCALALCLVLITPAEANNDVIFVSLNDNLLTLSTTTMPFWQDGLLYVPFTTFDMNVTGINLDVYASYSEHERSVSVYDLNKMLIFDLANDSCYNYHTGEVYDVKAVSRNGTFYVPAYMICTFFRLNYTYLQTTYGPLVRIKSDNYWLTDSQFVSATSTATLMSTRLREYNQSLTASTTTTTTPSTGTSTEVEETEEDHTPTYLALYYENSAATQTILTTLSASHTSALFLMTPEQIATDGNSVRQLLGSGHTIGILAQGETEWETADLLQVGSEALAAAAYTTTTIACVPTEHQGGLEEDGWVLWSGDISLTEGSTEGDLYRYATAIIRSLARDDSRIYLSMVGSEELAFHLSDILAQLKARSFDGQLVTEMVIA